MTKRIMTITMEVSDTEAATLLQNFADRGEVTMTGEVSTTTAPTTAPAGAEVDKDGVPWNALYHAGSKGKKADGTWTALRGMSEATKAEAAAYEASFKNPGPSATGGVPEGIPQFLQRNENGVTTPATPGGVPTMPVAPVATMPVAPVAAPTVAPVSFDELSKAFTETMARVGQDVVMGNLAEIYADAGVDAAGTSLQTNETQRAQVLAALNEL